MVDVFTTTYPTMKAFTDNNEQKVIKIRHLCTMRAKNEQILKVFNKSVIQLLIMHFARAYPFESLKFGIKLRTLQQHHNGGKLCLTME